MSSVSGARRHLRCLRICRYPGRSLRSPECVAARIMAAELRNGFVFSSPLQLASMGRFFITAFLLIGVAIAAKNPVTLDAVVNAPAASRPEIVWAPDGERFAVSEKGQILLYEVRSGKERAVIELDK